MQYDSFNKPKSGDAAFQSKLEFTRDKRQTKTTRKQALYRVNEIAGPNGMLGYGSLRPHGLTKPRSGPRLCAK